MASLVDWHVATRAVGSESGDQYLVEGTPESALVAVVDGLGHGHEAALAAKAAIAAIEAGPWENLGTLLTRCHETLRGTRGAVLSLASFGVGSLSWLGVGNVDGVLVRAGFEAPEHLLVRSGVVGRQLPSLRVWRTSVARGDTLILATDGVHRRFAEQAGGAFGTRPSAEQILVDHGKSTDDALVLVVRYVGPRA